MTFANHKQQSNQGFVRIIVILIILLLVFTFAGFGFQDSLSFDSLISQLKNLWAKLTILYQDTLQSPVQNYVVYPAVNIHAFIDTYIINEVSEFLQKIINKPPVR